MVFEIRRDLAHHLLFPRFLLGVIFLSFRPVGLFLTQVPQMDLTIVHSSCELIDVWQVLDALDEIIDEPRGVFGPVLDILFLLLIFRNFLLLAPTWPGLTILIRLIVRIAWLLLIVFREEEIDVPSDEEIDFSWGYGCHNTG